ncbi:hypothetical protein DVH05_019151 [Phytophthora capsici]|nr:hypothetical protein DVH05_019151 [Phytophthora capsici]
MWSALRLVKNGLVLLLMEAPVLLMRLLMGLIRNEKLSEKVKRGADVDEELEHESTGVHRK